MKHALLPTALALCLAANAWASPAPTAPTTDAQPAAESATPAPTPQARNLAGPPLNQYGAVDVNAKVPVSEQVPQAPADFTPPPINSVYQNWKNYLPTPPKLDVKSYLLMAAKSGDVLASYKANQRVAPASLTKLMLLYVTMHELANGTIHLSDKIRVPTVAWATGGSRMFLKPKTEVELRKLISGIIVDSGNDAAVTVATYIAGTQSAFVSMMNHDAKLLGMTNTHFNDVMGLPAPNHYSSARDMAVLAHAIVTQYPQYLDWFGQKYFTYNGIHQSNFNKLLFIYPYADGLKTGSTDAAGFSLVSTAKDPQKPMRLISVVMGAPTNMQSAKDSKALLTYGFRFYNAQLLYTAGEAMTHATVYKGTDSKVAVGVAQNIYATLPVSNQLKVSSSISLKTPLVAPIKKDQVLGTLTLKADGKVIKTVPAVALNAVPLSGWWGRTVDSVKLWF